MLSVCLSVCRSVSYLCWAGLSLHLMESWSVSALPKISLKTHKLILDSSDNASDQILRLSLQKSEGCSALSTAALHQLKRLNRLWNVFSAPHAASLRTALRGHPALIQGGAKRCGNVCKEASAACHLPPPKNNHRRLLCEWTALYLFISSSRLFAGSSSAQSGGRSLQTRSGRGGRSGRSGRRQRPMSHNWGGEACDCFSINNREKTETI